MSRLAEHLKDAAVVVLPWDFLDTEVIVSAD
jgi:hypothetical protein